MGNFFISGEDHRKFTMILRKYLHVTWLGITVACGLTGCDDTWQSATPVSRARAIADSGYNMPIPDHAINVRYYWSGSTQCWENYLAYDDSPEDLKKSIAAELVRYEQKKEDYKLGPAETYVEKPISREHITQFMQWYTPGWWRPDRIKHGYFIGSSDSAWGPHYWVDTDTGQVFYFEHSE